MATGVKVQKLKEDDSVVNITPIIDPEQDEQIKAASEIMDDTGDGSEQLALVGKNEVPEEPEFDEEPFEDLDA
jgi:hypothetical protein